MEQYLNTVLLMSLIGIVGWLGRRTITRLDEAVNHLAKINGRIDRLETRMAAEEKRNK
jgi:hypothetical protein